MKRLVVTLDFIAAPDPRRQSGQVGDSLVVAPPRGYNLALPDHVEGGFSRIYGEGQKPELELPTIAEGQFGVLSCWQCPELMPPEDTEIRPPAFETEEQEEIPQVSTVAELTDAVLRGRRVRYDRPVDLNLLAALACNTSNVLKEMFAGLGDTLPLEDDKSRIALKQLREELDVVQRKRSEPPETQRASSVPQQSTQKTEQLKQVDAAFAAINPVVKWFAVVMHNRLADTYPSRGWREIPVGEQVWSVLYRWRNVIDGAKMWLEADAGSIERKREQASLMRETLVDVAVALMALYDSLMVRERDDDYFEWVTAACHGLDTLRKTPLFTAMRLARDEKGDLVDVPKDAEPLFPATGLGKEVEHPLPGCITINDACLFPATGLGKEVEP